MINRITFEDYLSEKVLLPIIDVRTPAEFESGHIPGAFNIPLFSNEERAEVGTVYKQESVERAYELGYMFVEPKLDEFVAEADKVALNGKVAVYCWRGGMRSKAFAGHIEANGIQEVYVIEGGYKAFRTHALATFEKPQIIYILGGYTGSGKTKILHHLKKMGEQVIDLEEIAHHKGSAFGAIGQAEQPKNEHFTNLLYWTWKELDLEIPVWLEDESIHIGKVFIPQNLFQRMRDAHLYFLDIPKEERAAFLVKDYEVIDKSLLENSIRKIAKRLGGLKTKEALEALERNELFETALITLDYYDKFYQKGLNRRELVTMLKSDKVDTEKNVKMLLDKVQSLRKV
jgi:tRNA 2-selenouridine synthase